MLAPASRIAFSLCLSVLSTLTSAAQAEDWSPPGQTSQGKAKSFQLYQQASVLFQSGDYSKAIELYRKAISFDTQNKFAHHYLALALVKSGDSQQAISSFRNALYIDPNYVECHNNFGIALKNRGEANEAAQQFLECIRINPKYPYAYYNLGRINQSRGNLESAIENYQSAIRLKPDYFEAQRDLGLAMFERAKAGDMSEALNKLQHAAQLVPDNPQIHYNIGIVQCANARLDQAEAEFRQCLSIDPKHAAGHWELARLRYYRGDTHRAIFEIDAALAIDPDYGEKKEYPRVDPLLMKQMKARSLEYSGQESKAVDVWQEVADMQPHPEATIKHINLLVKDLKRNAKRRKVLPFDPAEIEALVLKGQSLQEDGDLDGAKRAFERAVELNPQSFAANENLGAILEAEGNLNGALVQYRTALALNPNYDGAYFNLAYVLEKAGLKTEAGNYYQRFHEMAGKYPYDPKHIVALQQDEARHRAAEQLRRSRGY